MGFFQQTRRNLPHEAAISIQQISTIQNSNPMVTVTFAIKPYLARYMYVRYGQSLELLSHNNPPSRLPIPIHLSHLTPIYHFLHQLSVPHPQGVSWKRQEISLLFFPAQGWARIRKFIIISARTVSLLSKRKLRWK